MKNIKIIRIVVEAMSLSTIDSAISDSIVLSVERVANVTLHHNSNQYNINYNDLLGSVKKDTNREV